MKLAEQPSDVVCGGETDIPLICCSALLPVFCGAASVELVEITEDGLLVAVVPCALLGVGENFVGRLDLGEEAGGVFDVAVIAVGVEFEGFAAVGFFDSVGSAE